MKKFFLIALLVQSILVYAGSVKIAGIICNSKTGESISYASVAFVKIQKGTTSLENGVFLIEIDSNELNYTLFISCFNFKSTTISVKDFLNNSSKKISLDPIIHQLSEVKITPKESIELTINKLNKSKINGALCISSLPTIITRYFEYNEELQYVSTIQIYCRPNYKNKKSKVRLRFFEPDSLTNLPSKDLVNKEIIVVLKSGKINEIDAKEYNIRVPKSGIYVGIEYLIIPENKYIRTSVDFNGKEKEMISYGPMLGLNYTPITKTYENIVGNWHKYDSHIVLLPQYKEKHYFDAAISITVTN